MNYMEVSIKKALDTQNQKIQYPRTLQNSPASKQGGRVLEIFKQGNDSTKRGRNIDDDEFEKLIQESIEKQNTNKSSDRVQPSTSNPINLDDLLNELNEHDRPKDPKESKGVNFN